MTECPKVMRTVVLAGHDRLGKLEYREGWPVPVAGKGELPHILFSLREGAA